MPSLSIVRGVQALPLPDQRRIEGCIGPRPEHAAMVLAVHGQRAGELLQVGLARFRALVVRDRGHHDPARRACGTGLGEQGARFLALARRQHQHQRERMFRQGILVAQFDADAFEPVRFRLERLGRGKPARAAAMQRRAFRARAGTAHLRSASATRRRRTDATGRRGRCRGERRSSAQCSGAPQRIAAWRRGPRACGPGPIIAMHAPSAQPQLRRAVASRGGQHDLARSSNRRRRWRRRTTRTRRRPRPAHAATRRSTRCRRARRRACAHAATFAAKSAGSASGRGSRKARTTLRWPRSRRRRRRAGSEPFLAQRAFLQAPLAFVRNDRWACSCGDSHAGRQPFAQALAAAEQVVLSVPSARPVMRAICAGAAIRRGGRG